MICIHGVASNMKNRFGIVLLICGLLSFSTGNTAAAAELYVSCPETTSMIVIDPIENVTHRGDNGAPIEVPIRQENPRTDMVLILSSGAYNPVTENVVLHLQFRVENLTADQYNWWQSFDSSYPYINGSGIDLEHMHLALTDSGTMPGGGAYYAEFTATIDTYAWRTSEDYSLFFASGEVVGFVIYRMYKSLELTEFDGREAGPVDHWFQITKPTFPPGVVEGAPANAFSVFTMNTEPAVGIDVTISGENAVYEPTSATTDAEGVFGVAAFTDPDHLETQPTARTTATGGKLLIEYENSIRERGLSGKYCEVVFIEGVVRVIGGSGTVKKGDILRPGQKLSLGSSWGERAQIALRFVNGSTCEIIQDVYTNACLTDIITIGSSGIVNNSVIQGKTPLASVSRTLCEKVAGLPSTPEQWARTAGRFAVTTGTSAIVPGSGIFAFALRYGVKTATGKVYDYVTTSPGTTNRRAVRASSSGDERMVVDSYYDGSTRIAGNIGTLSVYTNVDGASAPMTQVYAGQWVEVDETPGRTWNIPLEQVDGDGPVLRLGCEAFSEIYNTRFELSSFDLAGIDASSLSVKVNGADSTAFTTTDGQTWSAEFPGYPPGVGSLLFSLKNNAGITSTLEWSSTTMPAEPTIIRVFPGYWDGGSTYIRWSNPSGMASAEVLYHEVRQLWKEIPLTWTYGPWLSVGRVNETWLEVPETAALGMPFYVEVRTFDTSGASGFADRSDATAYAAEQPVPTVNPLPAISSMLLDN